VNRATPADARISHDAARSPYRPAIGIEFRPILPHCKKMPMEGPLFTQEER